MQKRGRGRPRKAGSTLVVKPHPMDPDIALLQGRRGPESRLWEATFRIGEQKIGPRSLGTEDETKAAFAAVAMKAGLASRVAAGQEVTRTRAEHTFGEAAKEAIAELERLIEETIATKGVDKAHKHSVHLRRIKAILAPAMGHMPVTAITEDWLHAWTRTLRVRIIPTQKDSPTRAPSQSTIGNLNHSFGKVMAVAARKGWLGKSPAPTMSKAGFEDGEARPEFTQEEVEALAKAMTTEWIAAAPKGVTREMRAILRAYVAVAATTGIRPGTELDRLTWGQVDLNAPTEFGRRAITFTVLRSQGKQKKERDAFAYQGPKAPFDVRRELDALLRLQGYANPPPRAALLFARPSDGHVADLSRVFRGLLIETDLLTERKSGEERSLYSLRHFYGTEAIARGVEGMTVADQMGTSLKMLERYCNKNRTRRHADLLSGAAEVIEAAVRRHRPSMEEELDAEEVDALVPWHRDIEEHEERAAGCRT